jgi:DNA-binding response OmpR family regulator
MSEAILVVEDNESVRKLIAISLKRHGYAVVEAWTVATATRLLKSMQFDALILDLELEDGDGYDLLRMDVAKTLPTLVVSARDQVIERLISLELGADDYLTKPIDMRELLLRLKRSIKRSDVISKWSESEIVLDTENQVALKLSERAIFRADSHVADLGSREFKALRLMIEHAGKTVTRETIAKDVMHRRVKGDSRAVDMLISALRRKLATASRTIAIRSVRGEGYILELANDPPSK